MSTVNCHRGAAAAAGWSCRGGNLPPVVIVNCGRDDRPGHPWLSQRRVFFRRFKCVKYSL
ncbi:MAG: hypothetical protein FWH14_04565 [Oscillospiraceae bacterium]|nr:hypothetical protein [Oscillospiraceae bacterium]